MKDLYQFSIIDLIKIKDKILNPILKSLKFVIIEKFNFVRFEYAVKVSQIILFCLSDGVM